MKDPGNDIKKSWRMMSDNRASMILAGLRVVMKLWIGHIKRRASEV